jgi:hypothetical protein
MSDRGAIGTLDTGAPGGCAAAAGLAGGVAGCVPGRGAAGSAVPLHGRDSSLNTSLAEPSMVLRFR